MSDKSFNFGWKFYKDYYREYFSNSRPSSPNEENAYFERLNQQLFNFRLPDSLPITRITVRKAVQSFRLKTIYPGLLIGSGYTHGMGAEGEIKIGFYFDHTTGLPVIPGSSVKGILRNAFDKYPDYVANLIEKACSAPSIKEQIEPLLWEIFEGRPGEKEPRNVSIYKQDAFLEAMVISGNPEGKILGSDFITPHKNPLKNPIPIQFIKVLPQVQFEFAFQLQDSKIIPAFKADKKCEVFKQILLDLGIGAKTNVGYGQLELVE